MDLVYDTGLLLFRVGAAGARERAGDRGGRGSRLRVRRYEYLLGLLLFRLATCLNLESEHNQKITYS